MRTKKVSVIIIIIIIIIIITSQYSRYFQDGLDIKDTFKVKCFNKDFLGLKRTLALQTSD